LTGCFNQRVVPPPAAPFAFAPKLDAAGNVVLDVAGRKADVYAVQQTEDVFLCTTPCAATLRAGTYTFRFTDPKNPHLTSTGDATVPPSGKILVRHVIGYERRLSPGAGLAGLTLGGVGLVAAFIGAASAAGSNTSTEAGSINQGIGAAMLIGGALMVGGATFILWFARGERQEGATTVRPL
jgi:hypothetical protein